MGVSARLIGPVGSGSVTKLVNQMIVANTTAVVCEAFTFARKEGVDPKTVFEAIRGGAAGSAVLDMKLPQMLASMNRGHAAVSDWGMGHLGGLAPQSIVELGCGGGRNAHRLLEEYPKAHLVAVDYSEESLAKTEQVNRDFVAEGRCMLVEANVCGLPLEDDSFDLATALNGGTKLSLRSTDKAGGAGRVY